MATRDLPYLLVVDLETTGLDAHRHHVVELAAVLLDGTTLEEVSAMGDYVLRLTGEHLEMMARASTRALDVNGYKDQGLRAGTPWTDLCEQLEGMAQARRVVLCGQHIPFDAAFLGYHWPGELGSAPSWLNDQRARLDLRHLGWLPVYLGEAQNRSLDDLCVWAGVARPSPHRALDDVRATAAVLRVMAARFGRGAENSALRAADDLA